MRKVVVRKRRDGPHTFPGGARCQGAEQIEGLKAQNPGFGAMIPTDAFNKAELSVHKNCIGNFSFVGCVFPALLALGVLVFFGWITIYRNTRVVKASQSFFLQLIASGVLLDERIFRSNVDG